MCTGDLKLYDCTIFGVHSGITAKGSLYIDGGVYEGYGHGGIYLSGASKTNYIYNAQINWAPMAEGTVADDIAGTNGAALYISGASGITTYIDNCDFNMNDGNGMIYKGEKIPFYGIVLRTSVGEDNNTVYISGSYVEAAERYMFRDPGVRNIKVYNGTGNDWSKANAVIGSSTTSLNPYIFITDTTDSYAPAP